MIAAVLHLHEHPRLAILKSFHEVRRHFADRHDVDDRYLFAASDAERSGEVERGAGRAPGRALHLVVIADDAIDFGHGRKHLGLDLRSAAGNDDARSRPLAL